MQVSTELNPHEAADHVQALRGLADSAEPALTDSELETLDAAAEFLEDAAGIKTGERYMNSPVTDTTYRVSRWIDAGDGHVVALAKEEVDPEEVRGE